MSLIIKIPNVIFTKPLPKLYRDAVIGESTLGVYDALNAVSWPKGGAPAAGNPSTDKWVSLLDGVADGLFVTTNGEITWADGFKSNSGSSVDKITLRNAVVPAAPAKFVGIVWVKHLAQAAGAGEHAIANFFGFGNIGWTADGISAVPADRLFFSGSGFAVREIPGGAPVAGAVYQLGVAYDNETLSCKAYVNGVEVVSASGYQVTQPSTTAWTLLNQAGYGTAYAGVAYRTLFDTLADDRNPADLVALDYALNSGRFA